ncbi:hypothetical protein PM082_002054 [Marasmius tenuissimus]|nr:hypothetical protein PM082_002054 [Marasmius tenuissimus]
MKRTLSVGMPKMRALRSNSVLRSSRMPTGSDIHIHTSLNHTVAFKDKAGALCGRNHTLASKKTYLSWWDAPRCGGNDRGGWTVPWRGGKPSRDVATTLSANLSSSTLSSKVQRRLQIIPVEMTSEL